MPNITLPDGKKINFNESITGFQLAEKISKSLSKEALIISVDGKLKDLDFKIENDSDKTSKLSKLNIDYRKDFSLLWYFILKIILNKTLLVKGIKRINPIKSVKILVEIL